MTAKSNSEQVTLFLNTFYAELSANSLQNSTLMNGLALVESAGKADSAFPFKTDDTETAFELAAALAKSTPSTHPLFPEIIATGLKIAAHHPNHEDCHIYLMKTAKQVHHTDLFPKVAETILKISSLEDNGLFRQGYTKQTEWLGQNPQHPSYRDLHSERAMGEDSLQDLLVQFLPLVKDQTTHNPDDTLFKAVVERAVGLTLSLSDQFTNTRLCDLANAIFDPAASVASQEFLMSPRHNIPPFRDIVVRQPEKILVASGLGGFKSVHRAGELPPSLKEVFVSSAAQGQLPTFETLAKQPWRPASSRHGHD